MAKDPAEPHAKRFKWPKRRRLLKRGQFLAIKERGRAKGGRYLVVGMLPEPDEDSFRLGLVTTRRCGGAVVRNRLRRRLREIVRRDQHRIASGIRISIVARHTAGGAGFEELRLEWRRLSERLGIMRGESRLEKGLRRKQSGT